MNPTAIKRMEGENWYRFCIIVPAEGRKSGYYGCSDLSKSMLQPQLRIIAEELLTMDVVEKFHFNLGGDEPDRLVVKFHDDVVVDDGRLMVIADLIGERLG